MKPFFLFSKDEIKLLKQKKKEALSYIDEDRKALAAAAKEAGVTLSLDENGLITNYTEAMTKVYNQLDAAITKANKDGNATESEQKRIETYDEVKDLVDRKNGCNSRFKTQTKVPRAPFRPL